MLDEWSHFIQTLFKKKTPLDVKTTALAGTRCILYLLERRRYDHQFMSLHGKKMSVNSEKRTLV